MCADFAGKRSQITASTKRESALVRERGDADIDREIYIERKTERDRVLYQKITNLLIIKNH